MVEVEDELEGVDLFPIFESAVQASTTLNETITPIWWPAHIRCAANTLNLLVTTDTENTLGSFAAFKSSFKISSFYCGNFDGFDHGKVGFNSF